MIEGSRLDVSPADASEADFFPNSGQCCRRVAVTRAVIGFVVSLLALAIGGFMPSPVLASPVLQGSAGTVSIKIIASTPSGDNTAFNGDPIAYTIIASNNLTQTIYNALILDVLPEGVLDNVQCLDAPGADPSSRCKLINVFHTIPEPLGGTLTVTSTRQISWTVPSLPPNGTVQRSFTANVGGQAQSSVFSNVAYFNYGLSKNSSFFETTSTDVSTTIRVRLQQGGATSLSDTPTWFSSDVGGTLSMDWADFDGDGSLDLALGSTLGTTIYHNENGRLVQFWTNTRRAYGVRWADVDNDGHPELIAVGEVAGDATANIAQQPGSNYIYKYDPAVRSSSGRFAQSGVFTSTFQMVRVEVGDFNGDGSTDIVASTNAINPDCPVSMFFNDGKGNFSGPGTCVSQAATAAIKPGDFNNDGHLDLALGLFPNKVRLLINNGKGDFSAINPISIEESVMFLPYDFAWGDYDGDGYLDLAAAYPLLREARIYHNNHGKGFDRPIIIRTNVFLTPYALDWGDFAGNGHIQLAVADSPPIIYKYTGNASNPFTRFAVLDQNVVHGQVWSVRAVDQNGNGQVDLAITDRDGPSLVVSNFRPPLSSAPTYLTELAPATSVAWGDVDGDGRLDLLFGAGSRASNSSSALNAKLFFNNDGQFPSDLVRLYNTGFGPNAVAFGDAKGDGTMSIALGTTSDVRVYAANDFLSPMWTVPDVGEKTLAWGDSRGIGSLDLLVGTATSDGQGSVQLYRNDQTGHFGTAPVWSDNVPGGVHSVSWADYNRDGFLDFAVGVNGANRIYRNNGDGSFTLAWTEPRTDDTRGVAWADYDADGDPDLAVGNYGQSNRLYENQNGNFVDIWHSTEVSKTTSIAWGDWNNDGYPDLAVGNYGEKDQIYSNLHSAPGSPQLEWLWSSDQSSNTTGVAWGDMENDGDLDLAFSQDGTSLNGIYVNNYNVPSSLATNTSLGTLSLVNQPSYVYTGRPGTTNNGYLYSAAEILSGPDAPVVGIGYKLYNANGARASSAGLQAPGAPILSTEFEYSVDGGSNWKPATPISSTFTPITMTTGVGTSGMFLWNAVADQAISDNARFRIGIVDSNQAGPVQRASSSTISPPFRVRATTCIWPEDLSVLPQPATSTGGSGSGIEYTVAANTSIEFIGRVLKGTGTLTYTWNFGNGDTAVGQKVSAQFSNGIHTMQVRVIGEPCPIARPRAESITLKVGTGHADLYLPMVMITGTQSVTSTTPAVTATVTATGRTQGAMAVAGSTRPRQVTGLAGDVELDNPRFGCAGNP